MSGKKYPRLYVQSISALVVFVTVVVVAFAILGIIAFPYYISPLVSGAEKAGSGGFLALFIIMLMLMTGGVYLLERRQVEWGYALIIAVLVISVLSIWALYGVNTVNYLTSP
ncbi:hypothetical protein [Sulfodiicoccus acidiphilus]|nr:hypothetical protein [Sulfodiicoccus acidiphilus]